MTLITSDVTSGKYSVTCSRCTTMSPGRRPSQGSRGRRAAPRRETAAMTLQGAPSSAPAARNDAAAGLLSLLRPLRALRQARDRVVAPSDDRRRRVAQRVDLGERPSASRGLVRRMFPPSVRARRGVLLLLALVALGHRRALDCSTTCGSATLRVVRAVRAPPSRRRSRPSACSTSSSRAGARS